MSLRCWQEWTSRSPQYVVSCAAGHKAPLAIQHREAAKGWGREINRKLRSEGVKVKLVLEFDNIEKVKRAVEIENGVSIVPEKAVRDEVETGLPETVEFNDPQLRRPLGALIRRSARVSPALRQFLALLERSTTSGADSTSSERKP